MEKILGDFRYWCLNFIIQYRPRALQHLHARKLPLNCVQYGGIPRNSELSLATKVMFCKSAIHVMYLNFWALGWSGVHFTWHGDVLLFWNKFNVSDFSTLYTVFFSTMRLNMVRVIEGKIIEKLSEQKQKLLRVSEGKITVTVWRKSRGNRLDYKSAMFELARVRTIGTRKIDFARDRQ